MPVKTHPITITFRGGLLDGHKRRLDEMCDDYESLSMDKEGEIFREEYDCKKVGRNKIEAKFIRSKKWRRQ